MIPWELITAGVVGIGLVIALRYPGSRRWLAALATLIGFVTGAFVVLVIGSFTMWGRGGAPPMPYVVGSIAILVAGVALATWIAFFRRRRGLA